MWLAFCSLDELSAIKAGNAPVSPVAGVAVGPTVTQLFPVYTLSCELVLSNQRSPPVVLKSPGGLTKGAAVAPVEIFQLVPEYTFNILFTVSHHNCPLSGFAGLDENEKFSNNLIKFSLINCPYPA